MTGYIIVAIMVVIILIFINKKRGTTDMKKPNITSSITTDIPIDKAMKTIINFAQNGGYRVDDFNEKEAIIVISKSGNNITHDGYIIPIYLSKQNDSKTNIEIGIKRKFGVNKGTEVNRNLEDCVNGIKTAIYAAS